MILVSLAEFDAIRKLRVRTLELPMRYGSCFGERKRCPVRKGGVYGLGVRVPYEQYRDLQPTRARSVLWLIDRCFEIPEPRRITVYDVHYESRLEKWIVRFVLGDHAGMLDEPVFLGRSEDYTLAKSQSLPGAGEVMGPSPKDVERARRVAKESRTRPVQASLRRAIGEVRTCRESMTSMKMRALAKRTERNLLALEEMSEEAMIDSGALDVSIGSTVEAERLPAPSTSATPKGARVGSRGSEAPS
jgi:hypothetical protein